MATAATSQAKLCSWKKCALAIDPTEGHTDVRAFDVSDRERSDMEIEWQQNGEAAFHRQCWSKVCRCKLGDLEAKLMKEAGKTAEHHDSDAKIIQEAERICNLIRSAKYCIAFTGAGISTAAGIGDFRGKDGKWTVRDKTKQFGSKGSLQNITNSIKASKPPKARRPTFTHEAIVKLLDLGHLKYVISQNTDGLHRLSGVPEERISELHGNTYVEKCEKCEKRYKRPYPVRQQKPETDAPPKKCDKCHINHRTGRKCDVKSCSGYLMNTIINFGDYLEEPVLDRATENAQKADLVLCLGTTLMVTPASSLVTMGKKPTRLIICNRQVTPYDDQCYTADPSTMRQNGSRTFGDCDRLMREVMKRMLSSPDFDQWLNDRDTRMMEYDLQRKV